MTTPRVGRMYGSARLWIGRTIPVEIGITNWTPTKKKGGHTMSWASKRSKNAADKVRLDTLRTRPTRSSISRTLLRIMNPTRSKLSCLETEATSSMWMFMRGTKATIWTSTLAIRSGDEFPSLFVGTPKRRLRMDCATLQNIKYLGRDDTYAYNANNAIECKEFAAK